MAAPTRRGTPTAPAGPSRPAAGMMMPSTDEDTQTRFLRALAQRLPLDRVVEAHVFPPIRQGGAETGLAVIAARREGVGDDAPAADDAPDAVGAEVGESPASPDLATDGNANGNADHPPPIADRFPARHTVFSARYRLTLKGPDRGKWDVDVVEEADAPLVTVDAVVRGVQRRGGEGPEPERFTAEQLRALVAEPGDTTAAAGRT